MYVHNPSGIFLRMPILSSGSGSLVSVEGSLPHDCHLPTRQNLSPRSILLRGGLGEKKFFTSDPCRCTPFSIGSLHLLHLGVKGGSPMCPSWLFHPKNNASNNTQKPPHGKKTRLRQILHNRSQLPSCPEWMLPPHFPTYSPLCHNDAKHLHACT